VKTESLTELIREEDKSIVIVGPWAPAVEGAGGVAAKCAELGKDVTFVCLCHSIYLGTVEEQEKRGHAIVDAIGGKDVIWLNEKDTEIQDTISLRHDLVRVYRKLKADTVITVSDQNPHPDAQGAARASSYAACHASLDMVLPKVRPIHTVQAVYQYPGYAFAMGFKPDVYVDITDVAQKKYEVLTMFAPEKIPEVYNYGALPPPWNRSSPIEQVLSKELWWGMASGVHYSEAFSSFWSSHLGVRAVTIR
jgi:LmbE family N-acetylglucosaminyl deacetylase